MCAQLRREALHTLEFGKIGRQRNALAAVGLAQPLGGRLAHIGFAGRDIDLSALGQEASGNHFANAARAARHQRSFALDRKEVIEVVSHGGSQS